MMEAVLSGQLGQCQVTTDRIQCYLRLEIALERFLVLIISRPKLKVGISLAPCPELWDRVISILSKARAIF